MTFVQKFLAVKIAAEADASGHVPAVTDYMNMRKGAITFLALTSVQTRAF